MGNQPSAPKPGTKFQVIGAGLSRTGTASFSEALHILLKGPVYHGGTQTCLGPESEILTWIKVLSHFPPKSPADKSLIENTLAQTFDGYAAATDAPAYGLVEELVDIYPDAMVICTIRDPEAWVKSIDGLAGTVTMWALRILLLPIPGLRYFVPFTDGLRMQWQHLYGVETPLTTQTYYRHIEYLKRVVPEDRLLFFDVRDGWEPLCKALGKEIPDVPFPRINDGKAIEELSKKMIRKGLMRWLAIFATVGVPLASYLYLK